jgi:hypothetical protein
MPGNAVTPGNAATSAPQTARRSLRLTLSLLTAAGAAIAVSFAVQPAAHAAAAHGATTASVVRPMSSFADCRANDPGDLCWWVGPNETGAMHPVRDAIYDWRTQKEATCGSGTWDDCPATLYNNNPGFGAQVYSEPYPKGGAPSSSDPGYCLPAGSTSGMILANLHYSNEVSLSLNKTISSNRWRTGGC